MTREEEIKRAAEEHTIADNEAQKIGLKPIMEQCFIAGAQFADEHPKFNPDKVIEWLKVNSNSFVWASYSQQEKGVNTGLLIEKFKKDFEI